jgi:hypothetical protein
MATNAELRLVQTTFYFDLLQMQAENKKSGIEVKGLKTMISRTKAGMTKEDIAWVEQQIAEIE